MREFKEIRINDINGNPIEWSKYENKKLLFVNVASECGFTKQYTQLQELYDHHQENLETIGLPCNDFGGQEPGSPEQIVNFCQKNYGVSFILTEKINITSEPHEIIEYLCNQEGEKLQIDWNFCKFLLNEDRSLLGFYKSSIDPMDEAILDNL